RVQRLLAGADHVDEAGIALAIDEDAVGLAGETVGQVASIKLSYGQHEYLGDGRPIAVEEHKSGDAPAMEISDVIEQEVAVVELPPRFHLDPLLLVPRFDGFWVGIAIESALNHIVVKQGWRPEPPGAGTGDNQQ